MPGTTGNKKPGDVQLDEIDLLEQPLNDKQKALVKRAYELFEFFRERLEYEHAEMHRARDMRQLVQAEKSATAPLSNTMNSCIDNVIADQLDNLPEAKMIPEREDTAQSAEEISDVIAYLLYHADWSQTYSDIMEDSVVTGTGIAQVFWDDDMEDGDGSVNVAMVHPEDFFPDPAFENIQDGRACFVAYRKTVAWVQEHFPDAGKYVQPDQATLVNEYVEDYYQAPSEDESTVLLEMWYKIYDSKKRKNRVHKAILAGHALLYSTELKFGGVDQSEYRTGVYAHGQYPFVMYKYRTVFRRPFGTGLVYDYREQQLAIDRYMKYIDDNARASAKQKTYIKRNAGVNVEDVVDYEKDVIEINTSGANFNEVVHVEQAQPLNGQVYQIMNYLADTMKQDSGQNQFMRGEGGLGITAASAIQALQEAGGKITRMHTANYKSAFKLMIEQMMWIMSEYFDQDRVFRIVGGWDSTGNMIDRLISLQAPAMEGDELKKPAYAVRVQVQKNNPLQLQVDNEFLNNCAQICAQAGQPLPPESVIGLMEGYRTKSSVLKVVRENSIVRQQIEALQEQVKQLSAQLEQQKKVNNGYMRALTSQGGGRAAAEMNNQEQGQPQGADYSNLLTGQQQG